MAQSSAHLRTGQAWHPDVGQMPHRHIVAGRRGSRMPLHGSIRNACLSHVGQVRPPAGQSGLQRNRADLVHSIREPPDHAPHLRGMPCLALRGSDAGLVQSIGDLLQCCSAPVHRHDDPSQAHPIIPFRNRVGGMHSFRFLGGHVNILRLSGSQSDACPQSFDMLPPAAPAIRVGGLSASDRSHEAFGKCTRPAYSNNRRIPDNLKVYSFTTEHPARRHPHRSMT